MYDSQVNKRYKCICNTTALDHKPVKVKEDLLKGKSRKTYLIWKSCIQITGILFLLSIDIKLKDKVLCLPVNLWELPPTNSSKGEILCVAFKRTKLYLVVAYMW